MVLTAHAATAHNAHAITIAISHMSKNMDADAHQGHASTDMIVQVKECSSVITADVLSVQYSMAAIIETIVRFACFHDMLM
jgi:hypothetical protein